MTASHLEFNYTTSVARLSRILVHTSQLYLISRTYILPIQICNRLHDCFLFKFVLLRHILVGHTNIFFCRRLTFNPFMRTFFTFYYSRFDFVWLHIILCSINFVICSIPRCPIRSPSLVCIKNNLFFVGIGPILNKDLKFIFWSYCSNRACVYS